MIIMILMISFYCHDRFSPDTFSFPPTNHLIFPLLKSQSRTRWKGSTQRSLSMAAAPQNRSGSVTERRYRSPWESRDNSVFQEPGEGRVVRYRCGTVSVRTWTEARLPRRLRKVWKSTRDRVRVLRQLWATVMLNPADPEDWLADWPESLSVSGALRWPRLDLHRHIVEQKSHDLRNLVAHANVKHVLFFSK